MIKRLILSLLVLLVSMNVVLADPAIDSFKGKTILGGIVELSWTVSDPDNSLDHLELYKGAQLMKDFDLTGGKFSDIYNDNSVEAGASYDYRIVVYNANSNQAESVLQVTIDNVPPKLTSPKSLVTNQKTITIETDENTVCEGGLKLGSTNVTYNLTLLEGKEKSHPLPLELVEGANVASVVCADESSNEFTNVEDITVVYDTAKPSKPNLNIKIEDGKAKLSWDAATDPSGIKGYTIYKSPDGSVFDPVNTIAETSFEEAVQSTTYYAIGAVDNAGNEERSDVKSAEVKSSAPAIQAAAVAPLANPPAQASASGSRFPWGIIMWTAFLAVIAVGLLMYFKKKNDKFGLDSYMHRRSRMR